MSLYAFGPFQLDVERLLLLHGGEPVPLGPKVVETLLALIEHPGDLLAKSALLDRVWPEGFVEEANLAQNIYVLRKTLRAHWEVDAIETVPRRGYRFVAPVSLVEHVAPSMPESIPAPAAAVELPKRRTASRRLIAMSAAVVFAVAIVILGVATLGTHRAASPALSSNGARLYAIGRYYWNLRTSDGVQKSLQYYARVVDTDPHDAIGYASLAEANATMSDYHYGSLPPQVYLARSRGYAEKALALDANSAEAFAALGLIDLDSHHYADALTELRKAIAIDSSYGPAHEWYGVTLLGQGQLHEGLHELELAADLDPLSVATTAWLGSAAYMDRRFDQAIAYSRQVLDLVPNRLDAYAIIGEAYESENNYPAAVAAFKKYKLSSPATRAEGAALLAHVYALEHRMDDARAELAYAKAHHMDVDQGDYALALAAAGEKHVAFELLRRLRSQSSSWMAIRNDPRFDALRSDSQFRQLSAPA